MKGLYERLPKYYCAPVYKNNFGGPKFSAHFFGNIFFDSNYGAHPLK